MPELPPPVPAHLADAYAACRRRARRHYENFPVASMLLPRRMRPHVAAVYAFARVADDFADEGSRPPAERLRLLDAWRGHLRTCVHVEPAGAGPEDAALFRALGYTIRACRLPVGLLEDLLSAFAQDVTVSRYATWTDLLDYCRRSANPIGRLVLRIAGYHDGDLDRASDDLCTALQLTNFWQDFARDWAGGRVYVPLEVSEAAGAREHTIDPSGLPREWRAALEMAARPARELFADGRAVCDGVRGRLRLELRLTWLGGTTVLDRLAASGYDPARHRPTLAPRDVPLLLWRAVTWSHR